MFIKCETITSGTTIPGNQTKGKYNTAIVGWSNANFWKGKGADKIAFATVNNKMKRQRKFHASIVTGLNFCFLNPK